MKQFYLLLCSFVCLPAQAYRSTTLFFEDKNGAKDSLQVTLGLSSQEKAAIPTYTQEAVEQEIKEGNHWTWLCNIGLYTLYQDLYVRTYVYEPYEGTIDQSMQIIYFPAERMPVTVSWNKHFFINNSLEGSLLTDYIAFDAVCGAEEVYAKMLILDDSCILHDTYDRAECTYEFWDEMRVKRLSIAVGTAQNSITALENTPSVPSATKFLQGMQILIERGGKAYTVQGTEVCISTAK